MRDAGAGAGSLAGKLLLAHPALTDKNFRRTVVLLAAHTPADGAMGVILNRPTGRTLGDATEGFAASPLAGIPLYEGGPVDTGRVLFAAWRWEASQRRLRLQFGIDRDAAVTLLRESTDTRVRAFLGHSGWTAGQLEDEIRADGWIVTGPGAAFADEKLDGPALWRSLLPGISPELRLLADSPDEPEKN